MASMIFKYFRFVVKWENNVSKTHKNAYMKKNSNNNLFTIIMHNFMHKRERLCQ